MQQPTFAVISAVYGVARYLPEFFASLESQTYPHERLRILLVDDGSVDGSGELCRQWASRTDLDVEVIRQENAGQAAARNRGIAHLRDEDWVTFTDPDDVLDERFFSEIAGYLADEPDVHLVAGHHSDYWEDDPDLGDRHALRFRFAHGNRTVDLERFPRNFHMHIASSCLRVPVLRASGLSFDERVRPVFEDAHLLAKYLLIAEQPTIAFIDTALYHYRRRGDGSSTMQAAKADPRRYTDVLEHGTLDLLQHAQQVKGRVPDWVQYEVIYDLAWIYRTEDALHGVHQGLSQEVCDRFHELVGRCVALMDPMNIEAYPDVKRTTAQREAMVHGYREEPWRWDAVVVDDVDEDRGLVKLVYHFTGEQPREEIFVAGNAIAPRHSKTRDFVYLRRPLVHERILWVSLRGTLSIRLDGVQMPLTSTWPSGASNTLRPAQIGRMHPRSARGRANVVASTAARHAGGPRPDSRRRSARRLERLAAGRPFAAVFRDAWVLMDRSNNAHDNAEHLFRYLRAHRRDINAWFVVKKDSPDWARLRAAGYKRLIAHGSLLWKLLCLNATHMISSHVDEYVVNPFPRRGGWRWRYVFLQHGVTQADLSRWLDSKTIDVLVTASQDEHAAIAGDGARYAFTTRETVLTGFPRHDRLVALAKERARTGRGGHVLLMPTWRAYFAGAVRGRTGERELNPEFYDSRFVREWVGLASSPRLHELCEREGLEIVLMPHPNLEPYLPGLELPPHVRVATYAQADVQEMIADAALMITDYSSVAFDAAIARRPLAYFQFDRAEFLGGGHIGRPGYFDYRSHGYGPVAATADEIIDFAESLAGRGYAVPDVYAQRTQSAFGDPDTKACARVTRAIEAVGRPLTKKQLRTPVPTPVAPPIAYDQLTGDAPTGPARAGTDLAS